MVDEKIAAAKIGLVQKALSRVEDFLPGTLEAFRADQTAQDVVTLNLFVALQECASLAAHVIADAGWSMPQSYRETFRELGVRKVLSSELAAQLQGAMGLRNLIAHQYGSLDFDRVYVFARDRRGDLTQFCRTIARMLV